jgi:glycerol kinase
MFNIDEQQWDDELLSLFNIPKTMLPEVLDSAADFGEIAHEWFGAAIPVQGIAGDQQAALFGQTCFAPGMAKSTYGTGCFMIVNTGEQCVKSQHRLLTTVAYRLNGQPTYALEGSIFMAGATIQWLRDGLQIIEHAKDTEALARQVAEPNPVVMVPAFTGLGAPYWDPHARGAMFGLTRDTGIKEIVAAALQSVGLQTKDLQKAMEKDGQRPTTLRVDGGMVNNTWLMQYLANILGAPVHIPKVTETTALGVAYLAGLQAGVFTSLAQISEMWQLENDYTPQWPKVQRDARYLEWQNAVAKVVTNA